MNEPFSALHRADILRSMAEKPLDLLVIGGGITGVGIAWDAALRGLKTGLVEMRDFSWGTSSRSTKLVHGGLRYLKQGEVGLVREVGRERALLHHKAPHIVIPAPMLLPIYKGGTYGYWMSSLGLYVYDLLAGVKRRERRKMYRRAKTMELEPLLKTDGLIGSGYYYEYRTDDSRLTVEIAKTAHARGAKLVNYAMAEGFVYENGKAVGVIVKDALSGDTYRVMAKKIVNAAGPWVDRVRGLDGQIKGKRLLLTKGVHLVVDRRRFPIRQSVYFDVPDGRMIFAIPRDGKTYIGTTDTFYDGPIEKPRVTAQDRDYLLNAVNLMFPSVKLTPDDVESAWAGLRPLIGEEGKSPSEISRKDEIFVSESGLISIAGGKLTGFRKMAEKVVDLVAEQLRAEEGASIGGSTTERDSISGGDRGGFADYEAFREHWIDEARSSGIAPEQTERLLGLYGSNIADVIDRFHKLGSEENDPETRLLKAEIGYCVEREMAAQAEDILVRRTGMILFDRPRAEAIADRVVAIMAGLIGWDDAEVSRQREQVRQQFEWATRYPDGEPGEQSS